MRLFATMAFAIVSIALAEIFIPGRVLYHSGWLNVLVIGCAILLGYALRPIVRSSGARTRSGAMVIALGVFLIAFATVVSGLLAPDARTIIAAPGSEIPLSDLGATLFFPVDTTAAVQVGRTGSTVSIGSWRYWGSSILQAVPRSVVGVDARDARGGTLTITQPSGGAFLSPVLLMQSTQTILGMKIPFDTFSVPATHRLVHVAALSARQAEQMRTSPASPAPAVIFAVDDDRDRPIPHAIAFSPSGTQASVGDMLLRGDVFEYPAIEVIAAPSMMVMVIGLLAIVAGLCLMIPTFFRPTLAREGPP